MVKNNRLRGNTMPLYATLRGVGESPDPVGMLFFSYYSSIQAHLPGRPQLKFCSCIGHFVSRWLGCHESRSIFAGATTLVCCRRTVYAKRLRGVRETCCKVCCCLLQVRTQRDALGRRAAALSVPPVRPQHAAHTQAKLRPTVPSSSSLRFH